MTSKITEAQQIVYDVLLEIGGWATSEQMQSHGGNIAAAIALIKHGMVEQRTYRSYWATDRNEWRAIRLSESLTRKDMINDKSVDGNICTAMMLLEMAGDGSHPEYGTIHDYTAAAHSFLQVARGGEHSCPNAEKMVTSILDDANYEDICMQPENQH